jgi:hypothetical protein
VADLAVPHVVVRRQPHRRPVRLDEPPSLRSCLSHVSAEFSERQRQGTHPQRQPAAEAVYVTYLLEGVERGRVGDVDAVEGVGRRLAPAIQHHHGHRLALGQPRVRRQLPRLPLRCRPRRHAMRCDRLLPGCLSGLSSRNASGRDKVKTGRSCAGFWRLLARRRRVLLVAVARLLCSGRLSARIEVPAQDVYRCNDRACSNSLFRETAIRSPVVLGGCVCVAHLEVALAPTIRDFKLCFQFPRCDVVSLGRRALVVLRFKAEQGPAVSRSSPTGCAQCPEERKRRQIGP